MSWCSSPDTMPLQDRCRHVRQVTQMSHEALDAQRKILPCSATLPTWVTGKPSSHGHSIPIPPWQPQPRLIIAKQEDAVLPRSWCMLWRPGALVPLWPHLCPTAPYQGVRTSHKPLQVRLTGQLAQG